MSKVERLGRSIDRSTRLQTQARNCLSIAVRERDEGYAATLIDEAVQLARRARELATGQADADITPRSTRASG